MYSFPDLEPVYCSMSSSNCWFLTCIQISQEAGQVVWYSHLFQNFPQFVVMHTVKGFCVFSKAKENAFLEISCLFNDPRMLEICFLVPLSFLHPAWTSGSSWFRYCWSLAWRILCITLLVWIWEQLCSSLNIFWHCLSLGLEWKLTFSSPVATAEFFRFAGILSAALSQHHLSGSETAQLYLLIPFYTMRF